MLTLMIKLMLMLKYYVVISSTDKMIAEIVCYLLSVTLSKFQLLKLL